MGFHSSELYSVFRLRLLPVLGTPTLLNTLVDGLARLGQHRLHAEFGRLEQFHAGDGLLVNLAVLNIAVDEEWSMCFQVGGPDDVVL